MENLKLAQERDETTGKIAGFSLTRKHGSAGAAVDLLDADARLDSIMKSATPLGWHWYRASQSISCICNPTPGEMLRHLFLTTERCGHGIPTDADPCEQIARLMQLGDDDAEIIGQRILREIECYLDDDDRSYIERRLSI